jgi:exopolysaccharide biosynthesis polyprenyl glycosylphosphotransferase
MSRKLELLITIIGDVAILTSIFVISWKASYINVPASSWNGVLANIVILLYWLFLFKSFDLYETRSSIQLMNELSKLFWVIVLGMITLIAGAYITNINFIKARGFLPSYVILSGILLVWRLLWRGIVGENVKALPSKVLIFKNGDPSEERHGFNVVKEIKFSEINPSTSKTIFKNNNIDGIVIESNGHAKEDILNLISQFAEGRYKIFISPKLYSYVYQHFLVNKVPESSFLQVIFHPLSNWDRFLKRVTDLIISTISLIIAAPLLLVTAALIKIDSRGAVLYRQKRIGLHGKKFELLKFRSMVADAEKHTGPVWAKKNDQRITRMGRIMRPFRIDELPQLLNVLSGEMSFIGPRPERPHFVSRFEHQIPFYRLRHNVHPGITGLAQVKYSYDRTIEDVRTKLQYDIEYINNISLRLDLKIFLKTIRTVLQKEGAH